MPIKKEATKTMDDLLVQTNDLLRKSLIVQLGLAGIAQVKIRSVVGGGMNEINAILKHIKGAN